MRVVKVTCAVTVLALVAIGLLLQGCGSSQPAALTKPDIVGRITSASSTLTGRIPAENRTVSIEGKIEKGASVDKASVTITKDTRLFSQSQGKVTALPNNTALTVGMQVQAKFTGQVLESYPVQATAAEIVIMTSTTIEGVKARHTAELMAMPGVAGVGIGQVNGRKVITVYLESSSPELKAGIPGTLEGFEVVTEVTGPIKTQ
ncbi:MAG: hypothetical protein ACYC99_10655 [Candidatus Geothermincolia bacterium]